MDPLARPLLVAQYFQLGFTRVDTGCMQYTCLCPEVGVAPLARPLLVAEYLGIARVDTCSMQYTFCDGPDCTNSVGCYLVLLEHQALSGQG